MRAAVLENGRVAVRHDFPTPSVDAGEALIRVRLAGICATDLQLLAGYKGGYQGVLGHEFVGEVVAAPGQEAWVGQRVVGELNVGCGRCELCRRGLAKHCRQRQSLGIIGRDGAFADYLALPVANLHPVPPTLSDEAAVFAEPLAAALEILEQAPISPSMRVYVVGDGRLGLLIAQVVAMTGCDLMVVGRHVHKLALLDDLGIRTQVDVDGSALERLAHLTGDVVVEATGSAAGFAAARRLVRPQGTLVLKSTFAGGKVDVDLSSLVVDEVTLVGSRCGPFEPALRLLAQGAVIVEPLIHARYDLDDCETALDHAARKGVLKVLVTP
jgi:threonine dehydrogenase-like Zn-dependent dehydrogenase